MNYRHAFHAGNFADLVKHAVLLAVLDRLTAAPAPLTVIDTHAGAGLYRLDAPAAQRSGEAQAGIARLMADPKPPAPLQRLVEAVRGFNPDGRLAVYPGSPALMVRRLRPGDRYVGCELHGEDHAALERNLGGAAAAGVERELLCADGYEVAANRLAASKARTVLLVDPPFERADDYARAAALLAVRTGGVRQPALVWTPLKDLETFDAFLGALEAARPHSLVVAQTRLRPLDDPMSMNGCAVVLIDAPDLDEAAQAACAWVAARLGGPGAVSRVERLV